MAKTSRKKPERPSEVTSDQIVPILRRLAIEAGAEIMKFYEGDSLEVEAKADESPVTAADKAADTLIWNGLSAAFPEIPVVTEEKASSHRTQAAEFFIVDPLDGTKEFIQKRGDFTVNIALVRDGTPVLGVVYAPAKGRLFYTTGTGGGRSRRSRSEPPVPGACPSSRRSHTVTRRPTPTSRATTWRTSKAPDRRSSSASSRQARQSSIRVSAGRWSGIRLRAMPFSAPRAAGS